MCILIIKIICTVVGKIWHFKKREEAHILHVGKGKSSACSPLKILYFLVLAIVLAAAVAFAVLYFQEKVFQINFGLKVEANPKCS